MSDRCDLRVAWRQPHRCAERSAVRKACTGAKRLQRMLRPVTCCCLSPARVQLNRGANAGPAVPRSKALDAGRALRAGRARRGARPVRSVHAAWSGTAQAQPPRKRRLGRPRAVALRAGAGCRVWISEVKGPRKRPQATRLVEDSSASAPAMPDALAAQNELTGSCHLVVGCRSSAALSAVRPARGR